MILDRNDYFLRAGNPAKDSIITGTSGDAQTLYSETRDLGAAGAMDNLLKKYLNLQGISALNAGTYTITLEHGSAVDASGAITTGLATALTLVSGANISATTKLKVLLPENLMRYVRIKAVTSGAVNADVGEFKAFLSMQ